jgi:hypothetical protein
MVKWFKDRIQVIQLIFQHSPFLAALAILQIAGFLILLVPPWAMTAPFHRIANSVPGYAWVIGWLALLGWSAIEYLLRRKERFDFTSKNFFKSYLDFIINEGGKLGAHSDDKDFYSKVSDWQRQVVEGIAIGLGTVESEKYFQKVDGKNPLTEAYRESLAAQRNDPLCRALLENIEELRTIRLSLTESESYEQGRIGAGKEQETVEAGSVKKMKRIGGSNLEKRGE